MYVRAPGSELHATEQAGGLRRMGAAAAVGHDR